MDVREIDLERKPAYLRELNPRNRVPVIEHSGHVLTESEALAEYVEEIVPEPRMMPADPAGRARVRSLMRRFEDLTDAYYAMRRGEPGAASELAAELEWVEDLLAAHPYLAGEEHTLADTGFWPWIVRVERVGGDLSAFPGIRSWAARLAERDEYREELAVLDAVMPPRSPAAG